MNEKKLKVAVTGSIGSGKSTFCGFLKKEGYPIIFADDIAKEILSLDLHVRDQIIKYFGKEAFSGKSVNKKFIAEAVFSNPKMLQRINSIIHPAVRRKIDEIALQYFRNNDIVFVEAALIYESSIEKMYDLIVLILADKHIRELRALNSKKFSKKDFVQRDKSQLADEVKINKADFVFYNSGTRKELQQKALLLISILHSYLK